MKDNHFVFLVVFAGHIALLVLLLTGETTMNKILPISMGLMFILIIEYAVWRPIQNGKYSGRNSRKS